MQAPAHRPHFLLLWIAVLLVAMTGVLKMLTADEQPVAAQDPTRALPPSPPVPIPFAEELPMLLDEHGQPISPVDAETRLAEDGTNQPQFRESPVETPSGAPVLASRVVEEVPRGVELDATLQPAPHEPREFPRWVGTSSAGAVAARDRLDPEQVLAAPPPFRFVVQGLAPEVASPTAARSGARKPTAVEVWVVPVTPVDLFAVALTPQDAGPDFSSEQEVGVTEEGVAEGDAADDRPAGDRDPLAAIALAARARALATGRFTQQDFAEILAEAQKRAGDRSVRSFFRRFSAAEFRSFLAQVLKTAA